MDGDYEKVLYGQFMDVVAKLDAMEAGRRNVPYEAGDHYEKGLYGQLMDIMSKLDAMGAEYKMKRCRKENGPARHAG